jgi:hypothetical protein
VAKNDLGNKWTRMIERQVKWSFVGISAILAVVLITHLI